MSFAPDKSAEDKGRINAVEDYLSLLTERIKFCFNGIDENIAQKSDGKRKNILFTVRLQAKWDISPLPASAVRYSTTMKIISQAAHTLTPKEAARRQQRQARMQKEAVQLQATHTHTLKGTAPQQAE